VVGRRIGIVWSRATVHTRLVNLLLAESEAAMADAQREADRATTG
jgi:hypothetical protein